MLVHTVTKVLPTHYSCRVWVGCCCCFVVLFIISLTVAVFNVFRPNVAVIVDWALETTSLPCTGFNGNPKGIAILGCTLLFSRPLWLRYTGWLG